MKAICADDELFAMQYTVRQLLQLPQIEEAKGFTRSREALDYLEGHPADLAVLDINMPEMDGIALAIRIKQMHPQTAILFLTAYREYAFDAFSVHPAGYLLKPVSLEELEAELSYAFKEEKSAPQSRIQARTFGEFELLADGNPVSFSRAKSKELLACLIDRQGGSITRAAAFAVLFEDEPYTRQRQKYMDVIIRSLKTTLDECGAGDILEMNRGGLRICPEKLDCDAYRFFSGDEEMVNSYRGEYMSSYTWASVMEAYMDRAKKS